VLGMVVGRKYLGRSGSWLSVVMTRAMMKGSEMTSWFVVLRYLPCTLESTIYRSYRLVDSASRIESSSM
jgi:hypothetical protein